MLLLLLWLAAAGYGAAVLWLMSQETRLVFGAVAALGDGRPSAPWQQVELPRSDGARQFAWVMPRADEASAPWVLYFHGSPSTVASPVNLAHYRLLRNLGLNVLAPEYRGFGGLEGRPTGSALESDARAAYDYLRAARQVAPARIVVYGWSLGSALAVDLAAQFPAAAVIVEGAPSSLADLGQQRYPFFPVRLLMRDPFDIIRKIARVPAPVLIMHSRSDEVIPFEEGKKLFAAAEGEKMFAEVRGGHLDGADVEGEQISGVVRVFLERYGVLQANAASPAESPDR